MKSLLKTFGVMVAVLLLSGGALLFHSLKQYNLVLPRTVLGDMYLGGLTFQEAHQKIRERLTAFEQTTIPIAARGEVQQVTLKDLGVVLNESMLMDQIPFAGNLSNGEILLWSVAGKRVKPDVSIDRTQILKVIDEKFPSIPKTRNAYFVLDKKKMKVVDAVEGVSPNVEALRASVRQNVMFLEAKPLFVEFQEKPPTVLAADLEEHQKLIEAHFPKVVTFTSDQKKWTVDFSKHPEWILFDRKPYNVAESELPFLLSFSSVPFENFVAENMASVLEQAPEGVRIWKDGKDKVQFEGRGSDGRRIERDELLASVNKVIANQGNEVAVPVSIVHAKVEISDELQAMGARELLATGYTRFEGSPTNRAFNIGVGISKFNGLLIPPNEVFSFAKNLGEVDGSTGYRKELVIKPEGTIPEYGGGICQVSSTMYRAAIFAGLPIVARTPHSYAVSYYAQVGGHGLDATVYPPNPDLKFKNDTPGYILVQSYVDGPAAYFKFYGMSDGRSVKMDGPYITNRHSASAEPMLVPDPSLAPGERKQVEKAHAGFDTLWYRYLTTKDGETIKEDIVSKYRATQNKFLVGGEVAPAAPVIDTQPNPFE